MSLFFTRHERIFEKSATEGAAGSAHGGEGIKWGPQTCTHTTSRVPNLRPCAAAWFGSTVRPIDKPTARSAENGQNLIGKRKCRKAHFCQPSPVMEPPPPLCHPCVSYLAPSHVHELSPVFAILCKFMAMGCIPFPFVTPVCSTWRQVMSVGCAPPLGHPCRSFAPIHINGMHPPVKPLWANKNQCL